jgi:succinate dehydrogenase / fumarate reductase flavoprotein subunit
MWNKVGMARNAKGLTEAIEEIAALREEFYKDVKVPGDAIVLIIRQSRSRC